MLCCPTTLNDRSCLLFIIWVSDWCRYAASNLTAWTYSGGLLSPLCILPEVKDNSEGRKMIINKRSHSHWLFHGDFEERNSLSRTQSDKRMPKIGPLRYGVRQHHTGSSWSVSAPHMLQTVRPHCRMTPSHSSVCLVSCLRSFSHSKHTVYASWHWDIDFSTFLDKWLHFYKKHFL